MKPHRLDSLTSLRFFAALVVVLFHAFEAWPTLLPVHFIAQVGWLGVTFFFVLSGFVIFWRWDARQPYTDFLARRLIRIYPLHAVTLAVVMLIFFKTGLVEWGFPTSGAGMLANLGLLQSWVPWHRDILFGWNGPSWSLSCEFAFYVAAPFLFAWLVRGRVWRTLLLAWLVLVALGCLAYQLRDMALRDLLMRLPAARFFEFALGAAAALHIRTSTIRVRPRVGVAACGAALAIWWLALGLLPSRLADPLLIDLFAPACAILIYALAQADSANVKSWLHARWLVFLGDASFALYMTHSILLGLMVQALRGHFPATSLLGGEAIRWGFALAAVAIAAAVHVGFEIPMRSALLRAWKRRGADAVLQQS